VLFRSVEARLFAQQWKVHQSQRQGQLSNADLESMLEGSAERLRSLLSIYPTAERWNLLGAAMRRHARVTPVDTAEGMLRRRELIEAACAAYRNAVEVLERLSDKALYYPLITLQQLQLGRVSGQVVRSDLERVLELVRAAAPDDEWAAGSLADIALLQSALELSLPEGWAGELSAEQRASALGVAGRYKEQLAKSGKQHHRDSVTDALDAMVELADDRLVRMWLEEVRTRFALEG
jgi:hypothetical protein